jgi:uncharacterized protein YqgC (DUF456 family)
MRLHPCGEGCNFERHVRMTSRTVQWQSRYSDAGMEVLLLVLGVCVVVVGVVCLALPLVPGVAIIFTGIVLVAWADDFTRIGPVMLGLLFVLTVVAMIADNVAGMFGARRAGASGWGVFGAGVGALIGLPFGLPGVILGPAVGALALEYMKNPDLARAGKAGLGGLLGYVLAVVAKAVFGLTLVSLAVIAYVF